MQKIKFILIISLFIFNLPKIFALIAGAEATQGCAARGQTEEEAASGTSKSSLSVW